jgi:hypothetical protein
VLQSKFVVDFFFDSIASEKVGDIVGATSPHDNELLIHRRRAKVKLIIIIVIVDCLLIGCFFSVAGYFSRVVARRHSRRCYF